MRDRQEKQAYLALVNLHIARLVEQCTDLAEQVDTLRAKKQQTKHLDEMFTKTLSALFSLKAARDRLKLELGTPDS